MRRRIDHRKLINGTMLAIETDEQQHKRYDLEDEKVMQMSYVSQISGKRIGKLITPLTYPQLATQNNSARYRDKQITYATCT